MKQKVTVGNKTFLIEQRNGSLLVNGEKRDVVVERLGEDRFLLLVDNRPVTVTIAGRNGNRMQLFTGGDTIEVELKDEKDLLLEQFGLQKAGSAPDRELRAPMPGLVVDVPVSENQSVKKGDPLVIIEAMKMENELQAHGDGIIQRIHISKGDPVSKNQLLIEVGA